MNESTERKYAPSVCESCGAEFGCGAKLDGCWCTELTLSESAAQEIKTKFGDCLCPKCLKKYATASAMTITYPDGSTEIITDAVRVDTQNFHEGMFDFYDANGNLLRQIDMGSEISWENIESLET